jgi:hypothetical protein
MIGISVGILVILAMFAAVIAILTVLIASGVRRRSQPRGFEVMERQVHEKQP